MSSPLMPAWMINAPETSGAACCGTFRITTTTTTTRSGWESVRI